MAVAELEGELAGTVGDGPPDLETGADGGMEFYSDRLQRERCSALAGPLVEGPQEGMDAVDNGGTEVRAPGKYRIYVQRIEVAGQLRKSDTLG